MHSVLSKCLCKNRIGEPLSRLESIVNIRINLDACVHVSEEEFETTSQLEPNISNTIYMQISQVTCELGCILPCRFQRESKDQVKQAGDIYWDKIVVAAEI